MASPVSVRPPGGEGTLDLFEFQELVSMALESPIEVHRLSDSFSQFEYKPPSTPISYHGRPSFTDSSHSTPLESPVPTSAPSPPMTPPPDSSPSSSSESKPPSRLQAAFKRIKRKASIHFKSIKKTASASIAFPASLAQTAQRLSSKSERPSPERPIPERSFTPYLPWAHQVERRGQATEGAGPSTGSLSDSPTSIQSAISAPVPTLARSSSNQSISTVTEADPTFPITPVTPSSAFAVLQNRNPDLDKNDKLTSRWSQYTDDDSGFLESNAHFPGSDSPSEYSQSGEAEEAPCPAPSNEGEGGALQASGARASVISSQAIITQDGNDNGSFGPYKIRDRSCSPLKGAESTSAEETILLMDAHLPFPSSPDMTRRVSTASSRKTSSGRSTGSKKDRTLTLPLNVLYPPSPQRRQTSLSSASGSIHGKSTRVLAQLRDEEGYESDVLEADDGDDPQLGPSPSSWPWPSPPPSPENLEPLRKSKRSQGEIVSFDAEASPKQINTPTCGAANRESRDIESVNTDEASVYYSACPGARSSHGSQVPHSEHDRTVH